MAHYWIELKNFYFQDQNSLKLIAIDESHIPKKKTTKEVIVESLKDVTQK